MTEGTGFVLALWKQYERSRQMKSTSVVETWARDVPDPEPADDPAEEPSHEGPTGPEPEYAPPGDDLAVPEPVDPE